jgi:hypothetical protein
MWLEMNEWMDGGAHFRRAMVRKAKERMRMNDDE